MPGCQHALRTRVRVGGRSFVRAFRDCERSIALPESQPEFLFGLNSEQMALFSFLHVRVEAVQKVRH